MKNSRSNEKWKTTLKLINKLSKTNVGQKLNVLAKCLPFGKTGVGVFFVWTRAVALFT